MKVVFLADAAQDIARLRAFIEPKSPGAAQKAVGAILGGCDSLSMFPGRGKLRDDGARQLSIPFGASAYIVRYRIDEIAAEIVVSRVKHGRERQT